MSTPGATVPVALAAYLAMADVSPPVSATPVRVKDGIPYSAHRQPLVLRQCERCDKKFWRTRAKVEARFCSRPCTDAHAIETGKFAGANNPRWLGGVQNDNMRYRRRQLEREPVQEAARRAVKNAVATGALVRQPCETCGTADRIEAHHDDYSKPLSVRWLCMTHHRAHHTAERRARVRGRIDRVGGKAP